MIFLLIIVLRKPLDGLKFEIYIIIINTGGNNTDEGWSMGEVI
jgi:hypothetical protein